MTNYRAQNIYGKCLMGAFDNDKLVNWSMAYNWIDRIEIAHNWAQLGLDAKIIHVWKKGSEQ